jgi:hypothetical protein
MKKRFCYRLCFICLAGFDSHGILYVVDAQNRRVQKFAFAADRP